MTEKEIAERLRVLANAPTLTIENRGELDRMANELDPPHYRRQGMSSQAHQALWGYTKDPTQTTRIFFDGALTEDELEEKRKQDKRRNGRDTRDAMEPETRKYCERLVRVLQEHGPLKAQTAREMAGIPAGKITPLKTSLATSYPQVWEDEGMMGVWR